MTRDEIQTKLSDEFIDKGFFGIFHVAPRVGKIKITLNCLNTKDDVIIAYPEVNIKKSWQDDIKKWKFKSKKIKYSTYMSFKKIDNPCDVLILDEIHLMSEAQMDSVAKYIKKFNIQKVLGLSGTLSDRTQEDLLKRLKLKVLVEYSISEAIKDGIVTDYKIDVHYTPLSTVKDIKIEWTGGTFMTSEKGSFDSLSKKIDSISNYNDFRARKQLKFNRLMRMGLIKKSRAKIQLTKDLIAVYGKKRILVFCGLTEIADSLGITSYHSKNESDTVRNEFMSGQIDKLAIVNKLNTGVTFPKLNLAIINFFDSNSENMAQKISRVTCMEYDNPDKIAHIVIVCSTEEIEKKWLNMSLAFFDQSKINHYN